jgi:hypothetical protein
VSVLISSLGTICILFSKHLIHSNIYQFSLLQYITFEEKNKSITLQMIESFMQSFYLPFVRNLHFWQQFCICMLTDNKPQKVPIFWLNRNKEKLLKNTQIAFQLLSFSFLQIGVIFISRFLFKCSRKRVHRAITCNKKFLFSLHSAVLYRQGNIRKKFLKYCTRIQGSNLQLRYLISKLRNKLADSIFIKKLSLERTFG